MRIKMNSYYFYSKLEGMEGKHHFGCHGQVTYNVTFNGLRNGNCLILLD